MQDRLNGPLFDLSTDDLFARVLEDLRTDDDAKLGALVALHARPSEGVVDRCVALCRSDDPHERTVGLRVLRELGFVVADVGHDAVWLPVEPLVLGLAEDDDPVVVRWAISCLGYQASGPTALEAVLGRAGHPDERVRFAVASALPGVAVEPGDDLDRPTPDERGVAALVELAGDPDADVRSYAVMGLVGDLHLTERLRPLLEGLVDDPDEQIRRYAASALAGEEG